MCVCSWSHALCVCVCVPVSIHLSRYVPGVGGVGGECRRREMVFGELEVSSDNPIPVNLYLKSASMTFCLNSTDFEIAYDDDGISDSNKVLVEAEETDDDGAPTISLQEMLDDLHITEDATGGEGAAMME